MEATILLQHFFRDIILTIKNYRTVFPFIKANKLWKGFLSYSWVSKFLLLVGALLSLKFGGLFSSWVGQVAVDGMSMNAFGHLLSESAYEGYHLFVQGGFKYVILILLEVVIFHFARKTLEVLTGEKAEDSLKAFISAQVRMLKVVLFAYVMETLLSILIGTLISMVGVEFIKPFVIFAIQCFFLGFVVVDNYNEIYKMSIKQSFKYTRQYAGVAMGIGVVLYVLMLVPVLGAVLAPLLGAVTATITMHELNQTDDLLELALVENDF